MPEAQTPTPHAPKPERVYFDEKASLFEADPNCKHEIKAQWSGVLCIRCKGWFCY